jgi:hypothetical protein
MTGNAIGSLNWARAGALALALAATPAAAQKPVTDTSVDPLDVALTPMGDLNLRRDAIPAVLQRAKDKPYDDAGAESCEDLLSEIGDLDAVLGEDYDAATPARRELNAGRIAQRVVGSLIPYRGIIREVSGAEKHEYEFRQAISAGLMRRAYLKGLGQARDCPYPARPMPAEMLAALSAAEDDEPSVETQATGASTVALQRAP